MTIPQLLEVILSKEDEEIKQLYLQLKAYLKSKEPKYFNISIINRNGNIAHKIQEETGFECEHKFPIQVMTASRGSNNIKIPAEQYTAELEKQLREKYEDC